MNRIQKLCILICVFSPFAIYGGYARGANIEDVILLWGLFVTSFVGIFLFFYLWRNVYSRLPSAVLQRLSKWLKSGIV